MLRIRALFLQMGFKSSSTLSLNEAISICSSQATMISQSRPTVDPHHRVSTISTANTERPHESPRISGSTTVCMPTTIDQSILTFKED